MGHATEMEKSPVLEPDLDSYYQYFIGMVRWMMEIGRVDIITGVSLLAPQLEIPREGHLEYFPDVYAFLQDKYNSRMALDPTYTEINKSSLKECEWKDSYGYCEEEVPSDDPKSRGKGDDLRLYVDIDHAREKRTRRSRSGFFIYMNTDLIKLFSNKQSTIETSVFGDDFVAIKIGKELLRGLRYNIRMMRVEIYGTLFIYDDNMSMIKNTQHLESTMNKKSNSIFYNAMRESVATGESITAHIGTNENIADLATKVLYGGK